MSVTRQTMGFVKRREIEFANKIEVYAGLHLVFDVRSFIKLSCRLAPSAIYIGYVTSLILQQASGKRHQHKYSQQAIHHVAIFSAKVVERIQAGYN